MYAPNWRLAIAQPPILRCISFKQILLNDKNQQVHIVVCTVVSTKFAIYDCLVVDLLHDLYRMVT